jgi:hypothetical protein
MKTKKEPRIVVSAIIRNRNKLLLIKENFRKRGIGKLLIEELLK